MVEWILMEKGEDERRRQAETRAIAVVRRGEPQRAAWRQRRRRFIVNDWATIIYGTEACQPQLSRKKFEIIKLFVIHV